MSKPIGATKLRTALEHVLIETEEPVSAVVQEGPEQATTIDADVLLVEDNIVNQKVATLLLKRLGCEVSVANNGAEALDAVQEHEFDIVFMDCQMPVMSGFEATQAIRVLDDPGKRSVPIVAMTANAMAGDRERCLVVGMNDYLPKPVQREALCKMLERWTRSQTTEKEPSPTATPMTSEEPSDVLDPEVLQTLRDLSGDEEPSLFDELVQIFLEDTPVRMADLEAAFDGADADGIMSAAHALKSSAANLGALGLSGIFKELETIGREKRLEEASSLIASVREEYDRVEEALKSELR